MVSLMGIMGELPEDSHHSGMLHSCLCSVFKKLGAPFVPVSKLPFC